MFLDINTILPEIRDYQIMQKLAAIGIRICPHALIALRSKLLQISTQRTILIEQLLRMIGLQPVFYHLRMFRLGHVDRNLMRTERALNVLAINDFRSGPSLRGAQHDHRPSRALRIAGLTRMFLDCKNLLNDLVHGLSHEPVHRHRIIAFYKVRLPAIALQQVFQLFMRDSRKNRRISNLISIQMQNRQNRAIRDRIQELIGMPRRCQRPRFSFAIADHYGCDQARIIKYRAEAMRQGIAQLAAFIDGARCFRSTMGRHSAREREALEHALQALFIL